MTSIPWETLLKNRTKLRSGRNSGMLIDAMKFVITKYPDAKLVQINPGEWQAEAEGHTISNPHNAHIDC